MGRKKVHGNAAPDQLSYYMRKKLEREQQAQIEQVPEVLETETEVEARLEKTFKAMDQLAMNTIAGDNLALIVSGPAGLGKSYTIENAANNYTGDRLVTVVKGFVRATGLYRVLYENRFPQCTVVFDDADSVFQNDISLNLLKGAADITRERKISWLAETKMLDEDGDRLPRSFKFEGSIIFITNHDFDAEIARRGSLAPHLEALVSRSQYIDLDMKSVRERMIRIRQVVKSGMLAARGLDPIAADEVVDFIETHKDKLREVSLRMAVKVANTRAANRFNWREIAYIANVPASKRR